MPARQLDLFDEIGLLVCEEHFGADALDQKKRMAETPQMEARWDRSSAGVIRRDRNHPCVVMWSLLNEVHDGRLFRNAVAAAGLLKLFVAEPSAEPPVGSERRFISPLMKKKSLSFRIAPPTRPPSWLWARPRRCSRSADSGLSARGTHSAPWARAVRRRPSGRRCG